MDFLNSISLIKLVIFVILIVIIFKVLLILVAYVIALLYVTISDFILSVQDWLYGKKIKKEESNNKEIAIKIIDEFEELLAKNNIKIPSQDREEIENEACIFGTEYYELEETIIDILENQK